MFFEKTPAFDTVNVHGLPYFDGDALELRTLLERCLSTPDAPALAVFTPNATIGARAVRDPALQSLLLSGDLLLPDGIGVVAASRRAHKNHPLRHRLPGIEAGETLIEQCARRALPVYFLGGREGVASEAAKRMQEKYSGLVIAGTHHGYFDPADRENETILTEVTENGTAAVLVCLGFPAQEQWIAENRSRLPGVRVFMGLGGSFDVWSGQAYRAPLLFRRLGLEWLWRSIRTPRRLSALPSMLNYIASATPKSAKRVENIGKNNRF